MKYARIKEISLTKLKVIVSTKAPFRGVCFFFFSTRSTVRDESKSKKAVSLKREPSTFSLLNSYAYLENQSIKKKKKMLQGFKRFKKGTFAPKGLNPFFEKNEKKNF
jgi:hypothetical protein